MSAALPSLALCLCCLLALSDCQRRRVESLPRLNFQPSFHQYSGYLNSTDNRRLFYWLVESSHAPPSLAPLVLWMNGGPGCSSVGGLLMTNGPFLANDRAELDRNEFAWNRLANVLYIDSPSGVGLSEPGPVDKSVLNDNVTTQLNLAALLHFYSLFPEYRGRPFYIAGESYAGIYIPLLASAIVSSGRHPQLINLTGIAVGNGLHVPYSFSQFQAARMILTDAMGASLGNSSIYSVSVQGGGMRTLNPYNIAQPCFDIAASSGYPCVNTTALVSYLNDRQARAALGVADSVSPEFTICDRHTHKAYQQLKRDVLDELVSLAELNVSVLMYHGTLDYLFPVGVNLQLLQRLPLDLESVWLYCLDKPGFGLQVGGVKRYFLDGRIRHLTVLGAGHSVPTDRPDVALKIVEDFLAQQPSMADFYVVMGSCQNNDLPGNEGPPRSSAGDLIQLPPMLLLAAVGSSLWAILRE